MTELVGQTQRHRERAAEATGNADVLAQAENARITRHLFADPFAQGLRNRHHCHAISPSIRSSWRINARGLLIKHVFEGVFG
ncbi:MAG: hypothetical protein M1546_24940 [Chloroflexi bacterium]|nr:hypothetical protein [Chloroflexota bacterium]